VLDVFKAALMEARPKNEREIRATLPRRTRNRPLRNTVHP